MSSLSGVVILVLLVAINLLTVVGAPDQCGGVSGWYAANGFLYFPNDTADSFGNHQQNCQQLISGKSNLATVDDNNIQFVSSSFSSWFFNNAQVWLNLQRTGNSTNFTQGWKWGNNSSPSFNSSNWITGQPDGSGNYGGFANVSSGTGYFFSAPNNHTFGSLCGILSMIRL
jgi:hypothetical protein